MHICLIASTTYDNKNMLEGVIIVPQLVEQF